MFDRLTQRILARLPSRRGAVAVTHVSPAGIHFRRADGQERTIGWDAIDRVVATSAAALVGSTAMLVIGLAAGGTAVVAETDPGWNALVDALPDHLTGAKPPARWKLEILDGTPAEVYRR